jgi:Ca2+-binding RTX toxin-like protein
MWPNLEFSDAGRDTLISSGDYALAAGVSIELMRLDDAAAFFNTLTGNELDQRICGNDEFNNLVGGGGDDVLIGGGSADHLWGGTGKDIFRYLDIADSGTNFRLTDMIRDFSHAEGDVIDLSGIDANSIRGGNQAFRLLGATTFDGRAGALILEVTAYGPTLYGDIDGDGIADFEIEVEMSGDLTATDLVL